MFKLPHSCTHLTHWQSNAQNSPSQASTVHEPWTSRCSMNRELPDVQAGFRKGRGTRDKLPTSVGSLKKQERCKKTSTSALLTMPKPLSLWITTNCGKFLKRWEYQTTWPVSRENCMQVKKQQLELHMEKQTGSKLGKEYVKALFCHSAYLTYMQSTSWEMLDWKKQAGIKIAGRNINNLIYTSRMQMTPLMWQKVKRD